MKSSRTTAAFLVSLGLHGILLAALLSLASTNSLKPVEPPPVTVRLLPEPKTEPAPAPALPTPPPEKKTPPPKPRPVRTAKPPTPAPVIRQAPAVEPAQPVVVPATPPVAQAAPAAPSPPPAPPAPAPPPVRTGVSIPASYAASNRKPVQPAMSLRYGEQGTVMLRVQVMADGSAGTVQVQQSSNFPMLDEAAQSAVKTWRFNPATVDGKPVTEWFRVPITFTLKN
jgi:protein TonB